MVPSSCLRRWLLPSWPVFLGIVLLVTLTANPWRTAMTTSDGDAFLWWRTGDWMIEHQQILRVDPFSHTRGGSEYITKEWLPNLLFAVAGNAAGLYGIAFVAAVIIAAAFGLLYRQLLREGNDPLTATLLAVVVTGIASTHWLARPHLFSFLFLVLAHTALRRYWQQQDPTRLGIKLTGLALLWVNCHGGFLMLFFLLGAYLAGAALERDRRQARDLAIVAGFCAVATLLNPNGWRLHWHTWQFLQSKFLTGWIVEYASPDFLTPGARGLLFWLALMFVTLALLRPRLRPAEGLTVVVWTYFALHSRRNIPLLVIITAPIFAPVLSDWVRRRWSGLAVRFSGLATDQTGWLTAAVVVVALAAWPRSVEVSPRDWPVAAVNVIQAEPARFRGPMFNQYTWGSYLLHALPGHAPFVDSRTDFYGEALIREFDTVTRLRPEWADTLDKYGVRWTLMPTSHRLNQALAVAPGWRHYYQDDVATIYVKQP